VQIGRKKTNIQEALCKSVMALCAKAAVGATGVAFSEKLREAYPMSD